MKTFSFVALLFGFFIAGFAQSSDALACSCRPLPKERIIASSDLVIVGKVLAVKTVGKQLHALVEAKETIKGTLPKNGIVTFVTRGNSAQCGYPFKVSEELMTVAAKTNKEGQLSVSNCKMYSLAKAEKREKAKKAKKAKLAKAAPKDEKAKLSDTFTKKKETNRTIALETCVTENGTGTANCAAICPAGLEVVSCGHSVGKLSAKDTCTSLMQVFAGSTDANGQVSSGSHDRCTVSAACSFTQQSLSVQSWARCVKP